MKKIFLPALALLIVAFAVASYNKSGTNVATATADQTAGTGEPMIGGAFSLTDQQGKTVKDAEFRGRMMLVFFGFTHCPDICPVTVKTLSELMGTLGDKADQVSPVFISVDPSRDTPAVIKDYLSNFDPRIVGLTGDAEQIKQVTGAYKAYYSKPQPAASEHDAHAAHAGGKSDYMVDHSGFIYLMDRDGKYVTHFPYDASVNTIADVLKTHLK